MNNTNQSIQISKQNMQNYKENISVTHNLGGFLTFYIFILFVLLYFYF